MSVMHPLKARSLVVARNKALKALKQAVNKKHGIGTMSNASVVMHIPRLNTGSMSFDRALGGGIPIGRTTIFRGSESSGKTTNAYRVIGLAQNLCANCYRPVDNLKVTWNEIEEEWEAHGECDCYQGDLFETHQYPDERLDEYKARIKRYETNSYEEFRVALFDLEGAFDRAWAKRLGVDDRRLVYVRPDTAEETGDIYDNLMRTGEVDLFVLDSIAAMTPSVEVVESLEKWQQGLQARLVGKFARKVQSSANAVAKDYKRLITQIWINQEREKIGISFGDNSVMPGGKAQLFGASVIVKMWASKWEKELQESDVIDELKSEIGTRVRMNFKVLKNKTAPAMQTGSYNMIIAGEQAGSVDEQKFFMSMAERFGFFRVEIEGKSKKNWYVGDERYNTKRDAIERINEFDIYKHVRNLIMDKLLGG